MSDQPTTIAVTRAVAAPPEAVFDAWLDAARAGAWLFATPTGRMVEVAMDPRVGGAFRIVDRRDGEDVAHLGTCLELERPSRLVFECGVRGEEVEDPLMRNIRYLDKLIDELVKGRPLDKILRQ